MTVLTVTMIVGVITVVALLVTRLPQVSAPPRLPASLTLPPGVVARAVTMGTGWIAVVTADDHILVFANDGSLRQDIPILPKTK